MVITVSSVLGLTFSVLFPSLEVLLRWVPLYCLSGQHRGLLLVRALADLFTYRSLNGE